MQAHLDGPATTLAMGWKLKLTDGTLRGFTTGDKTVSIDLTDLGDTDGPVTYEHTSAFERTDFQHRSGLSVANMDVIAILNSGQITSADLRAGIYDFTNIKLFIYNYEDLSPEMGQIALVHGQLSEVKFEDNIAVAELRDIVDLYNITKIVELYTHDCLADLGDFRCRTQMIPPDWAAGLQVEEPLIGDAQPPADFSPDAVNLVKPTVFNGFYFKAVQPGFTDTVEPSWVTTIGAITTESGGSSPEVSWEAIHALVFSGTVLAVTDQRNITISYGGFAPPGYFDQGVFTWTSGNNLGVPKAEVKSFLSVGSPDDPTVQLYLPAPFTINVGDAFTLKAGCDKSLEACVNKFFNRMNFRGFGVFIPGDDWRFRAPDAVAT
jgi:hypothetical protein